MRVTFHGVRGSIPAPGPSTVRYGGNTVCVEVRTADGTLIVLDGGTGMRTLGKQLARQTEIEPVHVFITHAHWDHILGVPFFAPFYRSDAKIWLHALSPLAHLRLSRAILFDGEHFPVRAHDLPARVERPPFVEETLRVGSARVSRVALNHPGGADGFRIDDADGSSLCYLTDNELAPPGATVTTPTDLARFCAGTGLLIHDAQYLKTDMPAKHGWGHSVVDDVLDLGRAAEARVLALHHHDPDRTDDEIDAIVAGAAVWTKEHAPSMRAIAATEKLVLDIAPP